MHLFQLMWLLASKMGAYSMLICYIVLLNELITRYIRFYNVMEFIPKKKINNF